jgi:acyl-CoA dehydrogenase
MAAVDSLAAFGAENLKQTYLGKLISGEWMGTMHLAPAVVGQPSRVPHLASICWYC